MGREQGMSKPARARMSETGLGVGGVADVKKIDYGSRNENVGR